MNDFHVSVLVVHKEWCEYRNLDRLVMEPSKDTHATFRNRDDRRQRKSPYTRNTGNRTIDYHTHRRRIHVPSHDHHATEPSGDPRTTLCTTVESWGWNVLRCTRWGCVESDGRSGPLWGPTGSTSVVPVTTGSPRLSFRARVNSLRRR